MAASTSPPALSTSLSSLNLSSPSSSTSTTQPRAPISQEITYRAYEGEQDLVHIVDLVDDELSEPYNLYTYRYFLDLWPHLCFFAFSGTLPVGVIISKLEPHSKTSLSSSLVPFSSPSEEQAWVERNYGEVLLDGDDESGKERGERKRYRMRGYLAMLSVRKDFRGKGIATHLLRLSLTQMLLPPPSQSLSPPPTSSDLPTTSQSIPTTPSSSSTKEEEETENTRFFPPDELVLETESDNLEALSFYQKMGFVREKELYRFYLNGKRAARLRLDLREMGIVG
ncbi:hypothetical protein JCM16303_006385 [Sporobolomyces ruberrimus]